MITYKNIEPERYTIVCAIVALYDEEIAQRYLSENYFPKDAEELASVAEMREMLRDFEADFQHLHDKMWRCDLCRGGDFNPLDSDDFIENCAIATVGELRNGNIFLYDGELYVMCDPLFGEVWKIDDDLHLDDFLMLDTSIEVVLFTEVEW